MRQFTFLTIALLVLAGCVTPPSETPAAASVDAFASAPSFALDDPAGDAYEASPEGVARYVACPPLCVPGSTSTAEAPYFDILSAAFDAETSDTLVFTLTIAQIDAAFPQLDGALAPMHRVAAYRICFALEGAAAERCAGADVYVHEGVPVVFGRLSIADPACNEWGVCEHAILASLVPGAPAELRLEVPKSLALRSDAPRISSLSASSGWSAYHPVWPWWHAAATVHEPTLGHQHKHVVPADYWEIADVLPAQDADIAWTPSPAVSALAAVDAPEMPLGPGNSIGQGSQFDEPQLDLLDLDMAEAEGDLVVTMRFAELPEDPGHDIQHILMFGVEGKDVYEIGWLHVGDESYGYAGHCISFECAGEHSDGLLAEHDMTGHSAIESPAEVVTGEGGTITIRAPLTAFPTVVAGDVTNFLWVMTQWSDFGEWEGSYEAGEHRDVHKMSFIDLRFGGAPHVFAEGNAPMDDGHEH